METFKFEHVDDILFMHTLISAKMYFANDF